VGLSTTATKNEAGKVTYPRLMISKSTEYVVLLTEINKGTVVHSTGVIALGTYNNNWDMSLFVPYYGRVEIVTE